MTERPAFAFKSGAEWLVPGDDFVQRSAKDTLIKRAFPAKRETHIEGWVSARL